MYAQYRATVEPVYYGHLGTSQKCPDYQGVLIFQVSLHDNVLVLGDSDIFSIHDSVGYTIHNYEYYHDTSRGV